ncbi:toll-like receptor 3 [Liolophura sinensis]|uniref:toll-like receptor 3 n=1 Tax=Liolophura sinensis TaxID=3198878 RepID=UPI0031590680
MYYSWRIITTLVLFFVVANESSHVCAPCACNLTSGTMECLSMPYLVPPPPGMKTLVLRDVDFGTFKHPSLNNLTRANISELTFIGCNLGAIKPMTLFSGLRHLKKLRLNRTTIIPENLRLAFYSLSSTEINEIYLDDMDIAPLPCHVFDGLKTSRIFLISLRGNSIRTLQFSDHADIFQEVPSLQALVLSENQIGAVEDNTFAELVALQHLFLDLNKIRRLEPSAFRIPSLVTLSIAENHFKFSSLEDTSKLFSHLSKLKVLNISGNDLKGVNPRNLVLLFRNLTLVTVLKLGHTGLTFLPSGIFRGLKMLKEIYLEGNQLKSWQPETFRRLNNLEALYLNKNKIQTVSLDKLYSVVNRTHTVHLNLANNPFSCTCQNRHFLQWLNQIQQKPVGYPNLYRCSSPFELFQTPLDQVTFNKQGCQNPEERGEGGFRKRGPCYPCQCDPTTLTCSGTGLAYIPRPPSSVTKVVFHSLHFHVLNQAILNNLTDNAITDFSITNSTIIAQSNDTFSQFSLKSLSLSGTLVTPEVIRQGLSSLQDKNITSLHLENMELRELPSNMFAHLKGIIHLTTLSLANNKLSSVPSDGNLFVTLSQLRHLDLSNNLLKALSNNSFKGLLSLCYLNLGSNRIQAVEPYVFTLSALTHLRFDKNRYVFSAADVGHMFHNVTRLQVLDLSGNNLSGLSPTMTETLLKPLEELHILSLDSTGLTDLPTGLLGDKPGLQVLSACNNRITEIVPSFFTRQTHLSALYLRGNKISKISTDVLDMLRDSNIEYLNLAKNPIECSCRSKEFMSWINTTHVTLVDYPESYICATPSGEYGKLVSDFRQDTCSNLLRHRLSYTTAIVVGVASGISVVLLVAVVIAVYCQRKKIWLSTLRFKARLRSQRIEALIEERI